MGLEIILIEVSTGPTSEIGSPEDINLECPAPRQCLNQFWCAVNELFIFRGQSLVDDGGES